MKLILLSRDLMLAARIEGAARACHLTMVSVANAADAIEATSDDDSRLLFVDLRLPNLKIAPMVAEVRSTAGDLPILACGPHVHRASLAAAEAAGCDLVVTRGQLDRDAEAIFERLVRVD